MLRNMTSSALIAAAACALTGCYSVPPYGAYPNLYAPGVPTYRQMPPRAGYIVPGEIIQAPPANIVTAPGTPSSTTPRLAPATTPKSTAAPAGDNPVPEPRDPSANGGRNTDRSTSLQADPFEPRLAESRFEFDTQDADADFQRPRVASASRALRPVAAETPLREPESEITPVGFEKVATHHPTFQWVQGFLQYSPRTQSWHLMYDANPGEDVNGGELKLTGNLPFTRAHLNKPFRVWGHFHDTLLDELKKPQYVVDRVEEIRPSMLESQ